MIESLTGAKVMPKKKPAIPQYSFTRELLKNIATEAIPETAKSVAALPGKIVKVNLQETAKGVKPLAASVSTPLVAVALIGATALIGFLIYKTRKP